MRVVVRVDASREMGVGHLVRCLTVADQLRARGASLSFVCREHPGHLIGLVQSRGIPVHALSLAPPGEGVTGDGYAAWLGGDARRDAEETIQAFGGEGPDWLIVDHYGADEEWERQVRPHVGQLLVIDDLGNRPHDCDVLLDQNYSVEGDDKYRDQVNARCLRLLGPRYALLREEYRLARAALMIRREDVSRVLVFFGGTDAANLTSVTLDALSQPALSHVSVDVVLGANNSNRQLVEARATARANTFLHSPVPHLADLLSQADLSIGAGGTTTWERMCLGVPSVVVSLAENQRPGCEALAAAGLISYAGPQAQVSIGPLADRVRRLCDDGLARAALSLNGQLLVDGMGAARVAQVIMPSAASALHLRAARADDAMLLHGWANERAVRLNAVNTDAIPWSGHQAWFRQKLSDQDCSLYVLEAADLPVGQIRFDAMEAGNVRISYSLDPIVRGRRWGVPLVAKGIERMRARGAKGFHADVRVENVASSRVFENLGFTEIASVLGQKFRSFYLGDLRYYTRP